MDLADAGNAGFSFSVAGLSVTASCAGPLAGLHICNRCAGPEVCMSDLALASASAFFAGLGALGPGFYESFCAVRESG